MENLIKKEFPNLVLYYYIDIEKFNEIGEMLQIAHVPQTFGIREGNLIDSFGGVDTEQNIKGFIRRLITA